MRFPGHNTAPHDKTSDYRLLTAFRANIITGHYRRIQRLPPRLTSRFFGALE